MQLLTPYLRYLTIPPGYGPTEGLRWSTNGEAIETLDGKTFIFTAMLPPFLEGFAAQRPLIHFVYMIELLRLLGHSDEPMDGIPRRQCMNICAAFRKGGMSLRNAGNFFGNICSDIPPAALSGGTGSGLAKWLTTYSFVRGWENPEKPPLDAETFRARLSEALHEYTEADLYQWFRFGQGPLRYEGIRLAEEIVEVKPPAFTGTLDDLIRQRSRLAGTLPLVGKMVSALALPPRRRAPPELPIGGYADVTNRGDPERLLPSQFALDPDEFVRRFAEKELLFFRREEPQRRTRDKLVLLLDQGVRTWGTVRLALAAAVLAFQKLAAKRDVSFVVRFSSANEERIDLSTCDLIAFANQLEASDLSACPAELLDSEMNEDNTAEADIVLLTHPRSLQDQEVKTSTIALPEGKRLFALAVDEEGSAQLGEMRHGELIPLSRFKVTFETWEPIVGPHESNDAPWTGDVEPVPFPFPIGPFKAIERLGFDADSVYLLLSTQSGYLYSWTLEGGRLEPLPRAIVDVKPLIVVEAILGVHGGFVIGGSLDGDRIAAHYDCNRRTVKVHRFASSTVGVPRWHVFPDLQAVAVRQTARCQGIDLVSGAVYADNVQMFRDDENAKLAYERALEREFSRPWISNCVEAPHLTPPRSPYLKICPENGELQLFNSKAPQVFRVIENGMAVQFAYGGAQLAENTLAFTGRRKVEHPGNPTWWLFDVPTGQLLGEYSMTEWLAGHLLSPDGRSFAMPTSRNQITVRAVGESGVNRVVTTTGKVHNKLSLQLGATSLNIVIGRKRHVLDWKEGPLKQHYGRIPKSETTDKSLVADRRGDPHPLAYDAARFISIASKNIDVLIDVAGQIIVHDPYRKRLVCIFRVRRGQFAAWMPDGTWYGPSDLTGHPATPNALSRLGDALRRASLPEGA